MARTVKRMMDSTLTQAKMSRGKFKDGKNHAVRMTRFFQNSTDNKR